MYHTSDEFTRIALSNSQTVATRVTVTIDGEPIGELAAVSGSVECDGTREGPLRTLSLTVAPHPDAYDLISIPGAEFVVERGFVLSDGTEELVPLGVFIVDDKIEEHADGSIDVSASDRSVRLARYQETASFFVEKNRPVGPAIKELVRMAWPCVDVGATLDLPTRNTRRRHNLVGFTILTNSKFSPWNTAKTIAGEAGYILYFDGLGRLQIRDTPDPRRGAACMTYFPGDQSVVIEMTREIDMSRIFNCVWCYWFSRAPLGPGVSLPSRFEADYAEDTDPLSSMRVDGPLGKITKFIKLVYAENAPVDYLKGEAERALAKGKTIAENTAMTIVPNPAHEAWDIIDVYEESGEKTTYMLDIVSIPLGVGDPMELTARQVERRIS